MLKTPIVILLTLFLLISKLADAQATTISMGGSTSTLSATYNTATVVDPNLTITANGTITNFRVQISQTYTSGDVLDFTGTLSGVTGAFNSTTGVLVFTGTASAADWQTLLRTVRFKSTSSTCYANQRRVTFTAGSVYYNPLTSHFYEYVAGSTTWTNAYTVSQAKSYFGRAGYLATIMSEAENNFIWKLMASDAWFGASDDYGYINTAKGSTVYANQSASEGKWHWVTGPEKGQNFSNNNTPSTTLVSGMYHKWAPGEPNGTSEAFGQFYSSNLGQWNDLANSTLGGYICEYGDMPNDLTTSVTILTRNITISGGSSGYINGGDTNVCSGINSTVLTLNSMTGSVVRWESSLDNFFTTGTTIVSTASSITASNLTKTTYYRAIVNSTSPTTCANLPSSSVFLSVKPTLSGSIFAANNTICSGGLVELTLSGQQGSVNKWQRSTDNINWTNISNTTTGLNETVSSAGSYYYRVEVQTPNCGSAVYSTGKLITVTSGTPPNGGSVSSASHATSTNSGTLTLTSYTGTVVKWQGSTNSGVTWTDIANTTASYAYSNQTDGTLFRAQLTSGICGNAYSQNGMITVNPFAYSGYAYNAENTGISGIPVKLYYKDKTQTTYILYSTYNTDATGKYTITTPLSTSIYDFRIEVSNLTFSTSPLSSDVQYFNQKILTQVFSAKDYYRIDANNNEMISIADIFLIYFRISGGISSWATYSTPSYRIFDSSQWLVINLSNSNLKSAYPGLQTIVFSNLTHNGATNFYIIKTGYKQ
jgi:hypothetical protein